MYNADLFLNTVNWLAEEEELISIRPKNALSPLWTSISWVRPDTLSSARRIAPGASVASCAIAGRADYVVTTDNDILVLDRVLEVSMVTPHQFVTILSADVDPEGGQEPP